MPQKFSGIHEKLKRADQNIRNLDRELRRFIKSGRYPVVPENKREITLKAIHYHKKRRIPPRFAVLAGEVVHHLRSCLDHIAWHFSSPEYREDPAKSRSIAFPIWDKEPVDKKGVPCFHGKVKAIPDAKVRELMRKFQPYDTPDPANDLLSILHHFDIFDKHRELVVCISSGARRLSANDEPIIESYKRAHPELNPAQVAFKFKGHGKLVPQVSFRNFGRRPIQPVIPGLTELRDATVSVVAEFAKLL
jgi:hypothetical protein